MPSIILISTGNELLYGNKTNTNSGVISFALRQAGMDVRAHLTVGDDRESLADAVRNSFDRVDAVIMTGGLGPTDDDLTVEALQDIFHYDTTVHEPSMIKMRGFFSGIGKDISDRDLKMVFVPDTAAIIPNRRGLAPGFIIERDRCCVIALPGVPHEMKDMLESSVIPFLSKKYGRAEGETVLFTLVGLKESEINESIASLNLDSEDVAWGMTAEGGLTNLYFSWKGIGGRDRSELERHFRSAFGAAVLGRGFSTPEEELLHMLIERKCTIGVAESCTGGLIAKRITDIPGSSRAFMGGIVAYSNEVKTRILDVPEKMLRRFGAVSEEVAVRMAAGARKALGCDIAVATSGIAGPDGGTDEKPVGTVCFGIDNRGVLTSFTHRLPGDRERIRRISSVWAVDSVRKILLSEKGVS